MIPAARDAIKCLERALLALDQAAKPPQYVQTEDLFGCLKYCRDQLAKRIERAESEASAYWLPPDQTVLLEDD